MTGSLMALLNLMFLSRLSDRAHDSCFLGCHSLTSLLLLTCARDTHIGSIFFGVPAAFRRATGGARSQELAQLEAYTSAKLRLQLT